MAKRCGRSLVVLWATACLLLSGCAGPGGRAHAPEASRAKESSPELDYLVGRDHELEGRLEQAAAAYERALSKDPESIFLLKQLAELSARQNQLKDALVYGERALQLEPDDLGLRLFLGTLYRFRRDADAALRVLRTPEGAPINDDAALLLYGVLADFRRYGEARDVAEWLIEDDPASLRGYLALSDALEKQGDPSAAEAALRRGLEAQPGELAFYGALARMRRERKDRAGEIEIHQEMLALHPGHHATLLARADAELALNRQEQAIATLEEIVGRYPEDLRSLLRLGFVELELERFEAARERFEQALVSQPEQHEVAYFLGVVQQRLEEDDAARATLESIPVEHDRYADARLQIAGIHERRGEFSEAIAEVQQARLAKPSRPLDLYLASLRAKAGDVDGALDFLDELLEESPDDAEVLYNIGVIHGEAREVEEAIRYMQIVLGKDPDHAGALNYVGYTWAEQGTNLDAAEAMISRALELRPDDGYITDSLGWVYYMRARPLLETGRIQEAHVFLDRALVELRRAAELTGGDPVIAEHLGDAYLALDQKTEALRMYEEALRLEPRIGEQPTLHDKLERLREELGAR